MQYLDRVIEGDCLEVMHLIPDNSIDLIATDPPYFRVKQAAWDRQWDKPAAFIDWIGRLCVEWQRILKPNGSLYVFASPKMAARVEVAIGERFNVLNRITWRKHDGTTNQGGLWSRADKEILRRYFEQKEEIIFAEHYSADNMAKGEAGYAAKCDELKGWVFEPLRAYLDEERKAAGLDFKAVRRIVGCADGSGLPSHWFTQSQWCLPTAANYAKLQQATGRFQRPHDSILPEYEGLRQKYERLRQQYEDLRRPFSVTPDVPYTDVWDFPTVKPYPGKHECEKPLPLIEHIIRTSSRPGGVVLDSFAGSGVTGEAALNLGRRFVLIEKDPHWCRVARNRLAKGQMRLTI